MIAKKWGLALSLTFAFGLMACDSSSGGKGGNTISCKVTSTSNSVTMSASYQGQSITEKVTLQGDNMIQTTTYSGMTQSEFNEECEDAKEYSFGDVTCEGKTITVKGEAYGVTIGKLKESAEEMCDEMKSMDEEDLEDR